MLWNVVDNTCNLDGACHSLSTACLILCFDNWSKNKRYSWLQATLKYGGIYIDMDHLSTRNFGRCVDWEWADHLLLRHIHGVITHCITLLLDPNWKSLFGDKSQWHVSSEAVFCFRAIPQWIRRSSSDASFLSSLILTQVDSMKLAENCGAGPLLFIRPFSVLLTCRALERCVRHN